MRIGVEFFHERKKMKLGILGIAIALLIVGCGEPAYYGKVDNTPYAVEECINELSREDEIDHNAKIDKIVVYKKKRVMYVYKEGKVVKRFVSL